MGHNISGVIATEMEKKPQTIDEYNLVIFDKFVQKSKKKK